MLKETVNLDLSYVALYNEYEYDEEEDNDIVSDVLIRRWNSDEWIEPTLEVYLEDCEKKYEE